MVRKVILWLCAGFIVVFILWIGFELVKAAPVVNPFAAPASPTPTATPSPMATPVLPPCTTTALPAAGTAVVRLGNGRVMPFHGEVRISEIEYPEMYTPEGGTVEVIGPGDIWIGIGGGGKLTIDPRCMSFDGKIRTWRGTVQAVSPAVLVITVPSSY